MKLFNSTQLREWDRYTCEEQQITSLQLMERAAAACVSSIKDRMREHPALNEVTILCGTGNNGGDGLAIARLLAASGIKIHVYILALSNHSPDFDANLYRLTQETVIPVHHVTEDTALPLFNSNTILIDCILGTGLNRLVDGLTGKVISHINSCNAFVLSIDVPSGLPAEFEGSNNLSSLPVVKAKRTLTFAQPKLSFLFPGSDAFTGEFEVLDIGLSATYYEQTNSGYCFTMQEDAKALVRPRSKFSHKGTFGHALMIAGSYGKTGAAVLACKAAMRTGCGLLTAYIPGAGYGIMQTALPEAMVMTDAGKEHITALPDTGTYAAVGIGPGIGTNELTAAAVAGWLGKIKKPLVMDADALNIIAKRMATGEKNMIPAGAILTPHPKEFERLAGESDSSFKRLMKQKEFAVQHGCIVVLKGGFTSVALPDGNIFFNSSGNPLLATAGSGDVLTGIITSFVAQGYPPADAALLGVYLHGCCADRRWNKKHATMLASDIIEEIPGALYELMNT